jgi:hypothetical protein
MDLDRQAAVIINDLDSLVHRIETLQAHPEYTTALAAVQAAKAAITRGRANIHNVEMERRFGTLISGGRD